MGVDQTCAYNAAKATQIKNSDYVQVAPASQIAPLMTAVATTPTAVTIQANRLCFQLYTSGIFNNVKCGANLEQTVTAVGCGTDSVGGDYWLVRNSWGEVGYIRITKV